MIGLSVFLVRQIGGIVELRPKILLLLVVLASSPGFSLASDGVPGRAAQNSGQDLSRAPLTMAQVVVWMEGGVESLRVAQLVKRQGIDFVPSNEFVDSLNALHARGELLNAVKGAMVVRSGGDAAKEQAAYVSLLAC